MRRQAAQGLAMVAWAERQLKKVKAQFQDEIDVQFVGEELHASVLVDGEPVEVATSKRIQNRPKLNAVDPVRFAEWVGQRHPDEIVPAVSEAFQAVLLDRMLDNPAGVLVDDDGEVCEWVEVVRPAPYTRTWLTKSADAALGPLLAGRSLADLVAFVEQEPQDLDGAA